MTSHIPDAPISDEKTGVAHLFHTLQAKSAFLQTSEERLERVKQKAAAFSHDAKLDDQCQLELRARWAEALLALAIHPSATAAEFERKLSAFAQIDPLILPCHHPRLFVLALSVAMTHSASQQRHEITPADLHYAVELADAGPTRRFGFV